MIVFNNSNIRKVSKNDLITYSKICKGFDFSSINILPALDIVKSDYCNRKKCYRDHYGNLKNTSNLNFPLTTNEYIQEIYNKSMEMLNKEFNSKKSLFLFPVTNSTDTPSLKNEHKIERKIKKICNELKEKEMKIITPVSDSTKPFEKEKIRPHKNIFPIYQYNSTTDNQRDPPLTKDIDILWYNSMGEKLLNEEKPLIIKKNSVPADKYKKEEIINENKIKNLDLVKPEISKRESNFEDVEEVSYSSHHKIQFMQEINVIPTMDQYISEISTLGLRMSVEEKIFENKNYPENMKNEEKSELHLLSLGNKYDTFMTDIEYESEFYTAYDCFDQNYWAKYQN